MVGRGQGNKPRGDGNMLLNQTEHLKFIYLAESQESGAADGQTSVLDAD